MNKKFYYNYFKFIIFYKIKKYNENKKINFFLHFFSSFED